MEEVKSNSSVNETTLERFSKEFEDTIKCGLKTFSCKRIGGMEDTELVRPIFDDSKDESDDSLNFLDSSDLGTKTLGPVIPENKRGLMSGVMERLGMIFERKQANRINMLQNWRISRLSQRIKMERNHSKANAIIISLFKKPAYEDTYYYYLMFFQRLRLLASPSAVQKEAFKESVLSNSTDILDRSLIQESSLKEEMKSTLKMKAEIQAENQKLRADLLGLSRVGVEGVGSTLSSINISQCIHAA